jgi:hypothetical protein
MQTCVCGVQSSGTAELSLNGSETRHAARDNVDSIRWWAIMTPDSELERIGSGFGEWKPAMHLRRLGVGESRVVPRNQGQRITKLRIETKESTFSCLWCHCRLEMGSCKAILVDLLLRPPASGGRSRTASANGSTHWGDENHKHSFVAHIQGPVNPHPVIYRAQKFELPFWGKPGRH